MFIAGKHNAISCPYCNGDLGGVGSRESRKQPDGVRSEPRALVLSVRQAARGTCRWKPLLHFLPN